MNYETVYPQFEEAYIRSMNDLTAHKLHYFVKNIVSEDLSNIPELWHTKPRLRNSFTTGPFSNFQDAKEEGVNFMIDSLVRRSEIINLLVPCENMPQEFHDFTCRTYGTAQDGDTNRSLAYFALNPIGKRDIHQIEIETLDYLRNNFKMQQKEAHTYIGSDNEVILKFSTQGISLYNSIQLRIASRPEIVEKILEESGMKRLEQVFGANKTEGIIDVIRKGKGYDMIFDEMLLDNIHNYDNIPKQQQVVLKYVI